MDDGNSQAEWAHQRHMLVLNRFIEQEKHARDSAHQLAMFALRALLLTNAGAAIGAITFYGNVATGGDAADYITPGPLKLAVLFWASGALAALLASLLGYLSQRSYAVTEFRFDGLYFVEEDSAKNKGKDTRGDIFLVAAILSAIASLLCFIVGVVMVAYAWPQPPVT